MEPIDYLDVTTHIRRDGSIYFGGEKLPGIIEDEGVIVKPGGPKGFNTLTVTFVVGHVVTEDPTSEKAEAQQSQQTPLAEHLRQRDLQQTSYPGSRP